MANNVEVEMDSICEMGTHSKTFRAKIVRYSLIKWLEKESYIRIGVFHLAGLSWGVHFYPNGSEDIDCIALYLELLSETAVPMIVDIECSLLDPEGETKGVMKSGYCTFSKQADKYGFWLMKRTVFEKSEYLNEDSLSVKLDLTVVKPFFVDATRKQIIVPSSDLYQHFGWLLENGEGADITLEIDDEVFSAHRNVLAARSPVFRAQLFGSMMESKMDKITIEDMSADVFKIMLQFIYTDILPPEVEFSFETAQHLLVAADRYGLERLKVICEKKLCDSLDVETAASTLLIADQQNCTQLKDVCIDFVASHDVLDAVMGTDGFKHLMLCTPLLLKEILDKVNSRWKI